MIALGTRVVVLARDSVAHRLHGKFGTVAGHRTTAFGDEVNDVHLDDDGSPEMVPGWPVNGRTWGLPDDALAIVGVE